MELNKPRLSIFFFFSLTYRLNISTAEVYLMELKLLSFVGSFAENKDLARKLRLEMIIPALDAKKEVTLNFGGIEGTTQSFIHALISDLFRTYGNGVLDRIYFKSCNENVQKIITIVVEYMQEAER